MTAEERFFDEHYQDRELYSHIEHPAIGSEPIFNLNWKMSKTPGKIQRRAPLMGEHNSYVFGELLGLSKEEINKLIDEKVIY
jgi:crotonobetainyl-CoA:carnitine CoA-transferase CaiB-like acyl-CoA transferase